MRALLPGQEQGQQDQRRRQRNQHQRRELQVQLGEDAHALPRLGQVRELKGLLPELHLIVIDQRQEDQQPVPPAHARRSAVAQADPEGVPEEDEQHRRPEPLVVHHRPDQEGIVGAAVQQLHNQQAVDAHDPYHGPHHGAPRPIRQPLSYVFHHVFVQSPYPVIRQSVFSYTNRSASVRQRFARKKRPKALD